MFSGVSAARKRAVARILGITIGLLYLSTPFLIYPLNASPSGRAGSALGVGSSPHLAGNPITTIVSNVTSIISNITSIVSNVTSFVNSTILHTVSTKWDPYDDFYSFLNFGLFNTGDCYGFSSTAILLFRHYESGDQSYPYYPEPTSSVAALPGQTGENCLLAICLAPGDTLYQSTFPIYIHQTYDPNNNVVVPSNEAPYIQLLEQSIQSGTPVILALGPSDFHAIVAWGYTQFANSSVVISVSDPNFGNVPRYASYDNGQFLYIGSESVYTTFSVISPGMIQWSWLAPEGTNAAQLSSTVTATNPYYSYVFSSVPITIVGQPGRASFSTTGGAPNFISTIQGAVGFEENGIQVYGVPVGERFTISDPGGTSSLITVIIPQNQTSIVGYQLTTTSLTSLNMTIAPTISGVGVTALDDIVSSVTFFSIGQSSHSFLNATSIPVKASQTAQFSVPNWAALNNTKSAAGLLVVQASKVIASYTLANGEEGLPASTNASTDLLPIAVVAAFVIISLVLFAYMRQRRRQKPI